MTERYNEDMNGPTADDMPAVNGNDGFDWAALSATASTLDERLAGGLEPTVGTRLGGRG